MSNQDYPCAGQQTGPAPETGTLWPLQCYQELPSPLVSLPSTHHVDSIGPFLSSHRLSLYSLALATPSVSVHTPQLFCDLVQVFYFLYFVIESILHDSLFPCRHPHHCSASWMESPTRSIRPHLSATLYSISCPHRPQAQQNKWACGSA